MTQLTVGLPTDTEISLELMIDGWKYTQRLVIKSVSRSPVAYMINRKRSGRGWKEHAVCGEGSRRPTALA
ncbi:jg25328 [Pararge aegeria aegeria]|uniref:Jg25328 protein n=1 Tax=Pararge aegeria aegeria TaxID=348720 RepID=A0A8S4RZG2_9NEOP|nr:jg25328 [Pararge aegeria aegeria]